MANLAFGPDTKDLSTWIERKRAAGRHSFALRRHLDNVAYDHPTRTDAALLALNLAGCGSWIATGHNGECECGAGKGNVLKGNFCQNRQCPRCAPILSKNSRDRIKAAVKRAFKGAGNYKALDVMFSIKNPEYQDLRTSIKKLQKAFRKFLKRPELKMCLSAIRSIEISPGADGRPHPHIHAIIFVPGSYHRNNKKLYIPFNDVVSWEAGEMVEPKRLSAKIGGCYTPVKRRVKLGLVSIWRECANLDYQPVCFIKDVKRGRDLDQAISHAIKYATKPEDYQRADGKPSAVSGEHLAWVAQAIRKVRLVECYGKLRKYTKEDETGIGDDEEPKVPIMPLYVDIQTWRRADRERDWKGGYVVLRSFENPKSWFDIREESQDVWPWMPFEREAAIARMTGVPVKPKFDEAPKLSKSDELTVVLDELRSSTQSDHTLDMVEAIEAGMRADPYFNFARALTLCNVLRLSESDFALDREIAAEIEAMHTDLRSSFAKWIKPGLALVA